MSRKFKLKIFILCMPTFIGFMTFFVIPFAKSVRYSFIDNFHTQKFIWFENYFNVLNNEYFQLALRNTMLFTIIGLTSLIVVSLFLSASLVSIGKKLEFIRDFFVLPMLLPTASIIFAWKLFFSDSTSHYALDSSFLTQISQIMPIYALFIWKNTGINVILLVAAISGIDKEVNEAAALDGASGIKKHMYITFPLITPVLFFVFILSFVNSFKVFKESYLFFDTNYPPDAVYTLQYYMNNHFFKLNYQTLTTGVNIFLLIVMVIIISVYAAENRYARSIW